MKCVNNVVNKKWQKMSKYLIAKGKSSYKKETICIMTKTKSDYRVLHTIS